jgi:hypothetical protein
MEGKDVNFSIEKNPDIKVLNIEDPSYNERKSYIVRYLLDGSINYSSSVDSLYMKVAHEQRPYGINSSSVKIHFPTGKIVPAPLVKLTASRSEGSVNSQVLNSTSYFTSSNITPYQGYSIRSEWPRGIISPNFSEGPQAIIIYKAIVFLIPVLYILMLGLSLYRYFSSIGIKKTNISLQTKLPHGIPLCLTYYIYKQAIDAKVIAASIIKLADMGYIRIRSKLISGVFDDSYTYSIEQVHVNYSKIDIFEKALMERLFKEGRIIKFADLVGLEMRLTEAFEVAANRIAKSELYLSHDPHKFNGLYIAYLAVASGIITLTALSIPYSDLKTIVTIEALALFAVGFAASLMLPARTAKGHIIYNHMKGLKDFICGNHYPEKGREFFSSTLPIAILFDHSKHFRNNTPESVDWFIGDEKSYDAMLDELIDIFE